MNSEIIKNFHCFLEESEELFYDQLHKQESRDYREGYYAGRLHASLFLKTLLSESVNKNSDS